MKFRTEIDLPSAQPFTLSHDDSVVMLGSCFTDNVGSLLCRDGFSVTHNPMGPLYNPLSILNALRFALCEADEREYTIISDAQGSYHCLDFASRYASISREDLIAQLDSELDALAHALDEASVVILTLGTAFVFSLAETGVVVGNCHKFPPQYFRRERMTVDDVALCIDTIKTLIPDKRIILTVSPIRHTADGLHGNQLSKAILQLGIDGALDSSTVYFPAYEIMLDDLRDYRFYAADMKHPSDTAVEYIYETFQQFFMTKPTLDAAAAARKASLRAAHRPILNS